MPEEINIAEVHSEEIQDIVGRAPTWIVRWGNIVVACLVFLILLGAWFIHYPDAISAPVTISASTPPIKIISLSNGHILKLYAKDGEQVKVNQIIAVIDNPANTKDMIYLKGIVEKIDTALDTQKAIKESNFAKKLQLGENQPDYAILFQAISKLKNTTEKNNMLSTVQSAAKKIKNQIAAWENRYVLRSPLNGKLTFLKSWNTNRYVNIGEIMFIIMPPNIQQLEIKAQLPIYKYGKIKIGQKVLIKLNQYPYEEFGMLKARVEKLANVTLDSTYTVQLKLENGLLTTRNHVITVSPEITGTADIITNDKNIIQRIFEGMYGKIHAR